MAHIKNSGIFNFLISSVIYLNFSTSLNATELTSDITASQGQVAKTYDGDDNLSSLTVGKSGSNPDRITITGGKGNNDAQGKDAMVFALGSGGVDDDNRTSVTIGYSSLIGGEGGNTADSDGFYGGAALSVQDEYINVTNSVNGILQAGDLSASQTGSSYNHIGAAVKLDDDYMNFTNYGSILSGGNSDDPDADKGYAIYFGENADSDLTVNLKSSSTISGDFAGMFYLDESAYTGAITNDASIDLSSGSGDFIRGEDGGEIDEFINNGTITLGSGDFLDGVSNGDIVSVSITNDGTISGNKVNFDGSFDLVNNGTITGVNNAIVIDSGNSDAEASTIENYGTITASSGAAIKGKVDDLYNYGGTINGNVDVTGDFVEFEISEGTVNGNINIDGGYRSEISLSGGATVNGNVTLDTHGDDIYLGEGAINGKLSIGESNEYWDSIYFEAAAGEEMTILGDNGVAIAFQGETVITTEDEGTVKLKGDIVNNGDSDDLSYLTLDYGATVALLGDSKMDLDFEHMDGDLDLNNYQLSFGSDGYDNDWGYDTMIKTKIGDGKIGNISSGSGDNYITISNDTTIKISKSGKITTGEYVFINATGAGGGSNLTANADEITIDEDIFGVFFTLKKSGEKLILVADAKDFGNGNKQKTFSRIEDAFAISDTALYNILNDMSDADLSIAMEALEPESSGANVQGSLVAQTAALNVTQSRMGSFRAGSSNISSGSAARKAKYLVSNGGNMTLSNNNFDNLLKLTSSEELHINDKVTSGLWIEGFGAIANQDTKGDKSGYIGRTIGTSFGFDREYDNVSFADKALFGMSLSLSRTDTDSRASYSEAAIEAKQLALYGTVIKDDYFYEGLISHGKNNHKSRRDIKVGAIDKVVTSSYNSYNLGAKAKIGKSYDLSNDRTLQPNIGLGYYKTETNPYEELGAGASGYMYEASNFETVKASFGLNYYGLEKLANNKGKRFYNISTEYEYDIVEDEMNNRVKFIGGGQDFTVENLKAERSTLKLGLGTGMLLDSGKSLSFDYNVEARKSFVSQQVLLRYKKMF